MVRDVKRPSGFKFGANESYDCLPDRRCDPTVNSVQRNDVEFFHVGISALEQLVKTGFDEPHIG